MFYGKRKKRIAYEQYSHIIDLYIYKCDGRVGQESGSILYQTIKDKENNTI